MSVSARSWKPKLPPKKRRDARVSSYGRDIRIILPGVRTGPGVARVAAKVFVGKRGSSGQRPSVWFRAAARYRLVARSLPGRLRGLTAALRVPEPEARIRALTEFE